MKSKSRGRSTPVRAAVRRFCALAAIVCAVAVSSSALAGAGFLGPGDEQLNSGEYFDTFSFTGNAGDELLIELSSSDFDPYVIVIDAGENPVAYQDDGVGAGYDVRLLVTLPATGVFHIVVTSALPGEVGRYRLSFSALGPAGAGAPPAKPGAAPADTPPTSQTARPGTVSGTAVDTSGEPIAGARVVITPSVTTGQVEVHTRADGSYLAENLPDVPYQIRAWHYVDHAGSQVCVRLAMDSLADYDSFSTGLGVVKNFSWQLTGAIPDQRESRGTFGGTLSLFNTWLFDAAGNSIEFVFTPTGPLVDGSTAETLTRTVDINADTYVRDVPIGPYRLTATLIEADGDRLPMLLSHSEYGDEPTAQLDINWSGDGSCNLGNGFDWTNVYVWLPE